MLIRTPETISDQEGVRVDFDLAQIRKTNPGWQLTEDKV